MVDGIESVDSLIENAKVAGPRSLLHRLVKECSRSSGREALERTLREDSDQPIAAAAAHALGTIASAESMHLMLELLGHPTFAFEAVRYLARTDTDEAGDRLIDIALDIDEPLSEVAAIGAAWRGDRRVTSRLLDLVVEDFPQPMPAGRFLNLAAVHALTVLGDPAAVPRLADYLEKAADIAGLVEYRVAEAGDLSAEAELQRQQDIHRSIGATPPDSLAPGYDPEERRQRIIASATSEANQHIDALAEALRSFDDQAGRDAVAAVSSVLGRQLDPELFRPEDAVDLQPEDLAVAAWSLDLELGDPDHHGTRFGGQPTWRSSPTWPLSASGKPMAFWAQFEIPWEPEKTAYLFIDTTEEAWLDDLGDSAALFVQPGGTPAVPWVSDATGPEVPDGIQRDTKYLPVWPHSFTSRVPSLTPYYEPREWPDGHFQAESPLNKIGGTPLPIQREPQLPTPDYRFLFQFSADAAGFEFGDSAECYGYVDPDTGSGFFHWDCH